MANAQAAEQDYIQKTFSQFGLNLNSLLTGGGGESEENKGDESSFALGGVVGGNANDKSMLGQGGLGSEHAGGQSAKFNSLLDAIPDFAFLSETTVSMGQLFA